MIKSRAQAVGMSVASYLRAIGAAYQPRAVVDRERVEAILRVNGDLGRLGGLLKLWLSDDAKLNAFGRGEMRPRIVSALRRIEENQNELRALVRLASRNVGAP
jgi:mobilization protein NikA